MSPLSFAEAQKIESDTVLTSRSEAKSEGYSALPGTRLEVSAMEKQFLGKGGEVKVLLGDKASESALMELNAASRLKEFQFIHLATHGLIDADEPMKSAILLAEESNRLSDSHLTAGEMLADWNIEAELVTLSACQTALGRYAESEGHIGFAQSLLLAGADSVMLSLWKVDDAATALLMQRFYQNIVGSRSSLSTPLSKHEALREAQSWLRDLTAKQANSLIAELPQLSRGEPVKINTKILDKAVSAGDRPFADPYFWSGFILVGHSK